MAILNDLEKGPWNPKNWHPTFGSGKLRFQIPDTMSVGDKKALIAALKEKFSNQIVIPGISFSSDWESDLARPGFINLDKLKYVEFDPNIDRSHTKHENKEIFRVFIIDRRTETERNHPRPQPTPPKKKEPEKPSEAEEAIKNVATFVAELPKDIILSRWDDLLKKISQAETFDELAQNLIFQILFLAPNALNDGLVAITGALDKVTQHWEKKLDEAKKTKLEALKKGLNNAQKKAEGGDTKGALETALLANLMGMNEQQRAEFLKNLQAHPEILQNNPALKQALQNPDIQNLLSGIRKPAAKPYVKIENTGSRNYKKTIEMRDDSTYKFTIERSGSPATYTYQMDFLKDGKAAKFVHDPNGTGKYILTHDGKTTTYDLATREVTITEPSGTTTRTTLSRDPEKAFQDIAPYAKALKEQETAFANDLKTLDKGHELTQRSREYFNSATSTDRKQKILQELKDMGITLNDPNNRSDWASELNKARKEKNTLLNPPPPKRTGYEQVQVIKEDAYTPKNGSNVVFASHGAGTRTGYFEKSEIEVLEDGSRGRNCTRVQRYKTNEDTFAEAIKYEDGSYTMDIQHMDHTGTSSQAISVACHESSSGLQGKIACVENGVLYQLRIQNGKITECSVYNQGSDDKNVYTLRHPVRITKNDIRHCIQSLGAETEPDKQHSFTPGELPILKKITDTKNEIARPITASVTHHISDQKEKEDLQKKIEGPTKSMNKNKQIVTDERAAIVRAKMDGRKRDEGR